MNTAPNNPRITASFIAYIVFLLSTASAMYIALHYFNAEYASPLMMRYMLPAEVFMVILLSIIVSRYFSWTEVGFSCPVERKSMVWLLPVFVVLIIGWLLLVKDVSKLEISGVQWNGFLIIGVVTMFVGISEELMFRGVILHALLEKTTPRMAVIWSALAFSLFHSINMISGVALQGMFLQLLSTFIAGFFLASVLLKVKTIIPLIIWHWFWDYLLIGGSALGYQSPAGISSLVLVELVLGLILWLRLKPLN